MKHIAPFFITLFCMSYTMEPEKLEKTINTKGITPLFHETDKDGIEKFNHMHFMLVNHITTILPQNDPDEFRKQSGHVHDDLKKLHKESGNVVVENFLQTLIAKQMRSYLTDPAFASSSSPESDSLNWSSMSSSGSAEEEE